MVNASAAPRDAASRAGWDLPLPGASFGDAVRRFFGKYAVFTGRASRSEYWWVYLFLLIVEIVPVVLLMVGVIASSVWAGQNPVRTDIGGDGNGNQVVVETDRGLIHAPTAWLIFLALGLMFVLWLAVIVPTLALVWRRMHDSNRPGPLALLALIPGVGGIILLVFMLLPSDPQGARFDQRR